MYLWKNMLLAHLHYRLEMSRLIESMKNRFEVKTDKMRGKVSAENLSLA